MTKATFWVHESIWTWLTLLYEEIHNLKVLDLIKVGMHIINYTYISNVFLESFFEEVASKFHDSFLFSLLGIFSYYIYKV